MNVEVGRIEEPKFVIEVVTDPAESERFRIAHERARRNLAWLQAHWGDLLPQARGKHVAVAGQEAFIADTAQAAWEWARSAHPDDTGAMVRYVRPTLGPRVYAHHG